MKNPFGLVYDNAISGNKLGAVNIKPVSYGVNGIKVAANLYLPVNFDEQKNMLEARWRIQMVAVRSKWRGCMCKRIKAVATLSMFNSGRVRRNGFLDGDKDGAQVRLEKAAAAHNAELEGDITYEAFLPPNKTDDELKAMMTEMPENTLYRDGIEYYGITYKHPNATGSYTTESFMKLMAFDVKDRMDLLTQPLLMIAGEEADTLYMTKDAYRKAANAKNKELYLIPGASHIRTYWVPEYVDQAVAKLDKFFHKYL